FSLEFRALLTVYAMSADWSNGLCGCFNDFGICIITYFLPCYTFGKNAEAVGESCCLCCLCYGCSPFDLAAKVAVRARIRHQKGIAGTIAGDIVYHVFCTTCAICQEAQELKTGVKNMSMARE
ncbi:hypothetical protein EMCRGX_G000987, partial [Ephydatia muelleri]